MDRVTQRQEKRRASFQRLRTAYRSNTELAETLGDGFSDSYVSQLLRGHRGIGDEVADKIESRLGLDHGWLDQDHSTPADSQSPESSTPRLAAPDGDDDPHLLRSLHDIPIFRLEAFMQDPMDTAACDGSLAVPGNIGKNAYAVKIEDDTMLGATPPLGRGMLLVFDPEREARHQSIVLAGASGTRPVIRQLLIDGHDLYLSAPQSGLPPRRVEREAIRAVAVKAVIDLLSP